jgi:hypothetical protein
MSQPKQAKRWPVARTAPNKLAVTMNAERSGKFLKAKIYLAQIRQIAQREPCIFAAMPILAIRFGGGRYDDRW